MLFWRTLCVPLSFFRSDLKWMVHTSSSDILVQILEVYEVIWFEFKGNYCGEFPSENGKIDWTFEFLFQVMRLLHVLFSCQLNWNLHQFWKTHWQRNPLIHRQKICILSWMTRKFQLTSATFFSFSASRQVSVRCELLTMSTSTPDNCRSHEVHFASPCSFALSSFWLRWKVWQALTWFPLSVLHCLFVSFFLLLQIISEWMKVNLYLSYATTIYAESRLLYAL